MTKSYVSYKEFRDSISKLEERMNKLEISFVELKTKFNDELLDTTKTEMNRQKWRFGIVMSVISGIVSFAVAVLA